MTIEEFEILEGYYPKLYKIVLNQSCSNFSLEMKDKVMKILKNNNRAAGLCGKCNSSLVRIAEEACKLYVQNKDIFIKQEENGKAEEKKSIKRRRQSRKTV